eukprot:jgi/Ulvmu1/9582/UM054_0012.1
MCQIDLSAAEEVTEETYSSWKRWKWQPTGTATSTSLALRSFDSDAAADSTDAESAPQRTIMQCLGTEALTRACHFENVYYAISSKRFVYFGPDGSASELFGKGKPGEPWLRLIRAIAAVANIEDALQWHAYVYAAAEDV